MEEISLEEKKRLRKKEQARIYRATHRVELRAYSRRYGAAKRRAAGILPRERVSPEEQRRRKRIHDSAYNSVRKKDPLWQKLHCEAVLRSHKRYPEKHSARNRVTYALKKGTLVKLPCEICGNPNSEAHHDDYSKALEVRWFCNLHHRQYHKGLLTKI